MSSVFSSYDEQKKLHCLKIQTSEEIPAKKNQRTN